MQRSPVSNTAPSFILTTERPELAQRIRATLEHVYPGLAIEQTDDPKSVAGMNASLALVDTDFVSGAALDHLMGTLPEMPAILLVDGLEAIRPLKHLLVSRRSMVTADDLDGMGLIQAVHHLLERQQLHDQLQKAARHIQKLAVRDDLTRLYNHRQFTEMLTNEVKKATRYARPLALLIVSIKNLSEINKARGHTEGDRVLSKASDIIRALVREVDIPTRYGDNEFGIILPETEEAAAMVVARRITEALGAITIESERGPMALTISTGIAALSERVNTRDELLRMAIGALMEAKRNPGSRQCTSHELTQHAQEMVIDRALIERLSQRCEKLSTNTQRAYFQSVMKAIGACERFKLIAAHAERTAFFAKRLAESLGADTDEAQVLYRAGLLHDIGMLAIDEEIFAKSEALSPTERDAIEEHPGLALQIIGDSPMLTRELAAIAHHHERFDGTGYPEGLAGNAIPRSSQILAIAEAWDAMTSVQPFRREPLPLNTALEELTRNAGTQFDPQLVTAFTKLVAGS